MAYADDDSQAAAAMLTTTDVAGQLGYSEEQVRRMCEQGKFDGDGGRVPGAFRPGIGSHWRIPAAAVEHFRAMSRPKVVVRGARRR